MRADRISRIRDYQTQNNHDYEPQDRYRDSRGREHYNNSRYAPRNDYRDEYTDYYDDRRRIGFSYEPRMGESYGGEYDRVYAGGYDRMTRELADEWMRGLENEDGSRGAHWSYEQTKNILEQKKIDGDPMEFLLRISTSTTRSFTPTLPKRSFAIRTRTTISLFGITSVSSSDQRKKEGLSALLF